MPHGTPNAFELEQDAQLEDLLDAPARKPQPDAAEPDEPDADFDDLNALLAESLTTVKETAEAKIARERLKRGGITAEERRADAERIAAWEAKHEWLDVANVGQFSRFSCGCGTSYTVFTQLMVRQRHRHLRDSFRWQQQQTAQAALPNETVIADYPVKTCAGCADSKGWIMAHATEWKF
jgi:hypothetical protein